MDVNYLNYSYIYIDDCLTHEVNFPADTAVFVDNFCGTLNINGVDLEEINIIENHGTIRPLSTGHSLEWLTVYQNYGLINA